MNKTFKKSVIFSLATVLLSQSVAFAAQQTNREAAIDQTLIDASLMAQGQDMKKSVAQIEEMIKSIEAFKNASTSEKETFLINTARMLITFLGVSAGAVHIKNKHIESSASLSTAAVAGLLSSLLEAYAQNKKIDMTQIKGLLLENQKILSAEVGLVDKETGEMIIDAVKQIGDINSQLQTNATQIQQMLDNGQMGAAVVAVSTIALNYLGPILPKKLKEAIANKAPVMIEKSKNAAQKGHKAGVQTLAGTNGITMISTLVGMSSKDAQTQINSILSNLYVARAKLIQETK